MSQKPKSNPPPLKSFNDAIFQKRMSEKYEDLYKYYNSIYHNDQMFNSLIDSIYNFYQERSDTLKNLDEQRLSNPKWFCQNDSIGIQIYADKFAGNLHNIENKLDYLQGLGIKYLYSLPILDSPPKKSDGGFAVSNYRKVREDLGNVEDLKHLINSLHERGMCFCMDFIINHTSDEHEWAQRAKKGEIGYQNRYYFYDSWYIPNKFDSFEFNRFFGDMAPDNFTFVPEIKKIVMTTFYPFQWDLNFTNPIVFNEMVSNILFLTNLGVDFLLFNGCPNLWKKPGTSCRMLKQAYVINYMIFIIMQIVCPGVISWIDVKRHKKKKEENEKLNSIKLHNDFDSMFYHFNDESESENENDFVITNSGIISKDDAAENYSSSTILHVDEEEEEDIIDFDQSLEIGNIHYNYPWVSRLFGSLALCDVHSIQFSIDAICNRFEDSSYFIRVQSHDDINWGHGYESNKNRMIGNGLENDDSYTGDIIPLYRYLNDFYTGNMPGSFSKGFTFAENLSTGKASICGRTASLMGLEKAINEEEKIKKRIKNVKKPNQTAISNKLNQIANSIQNSVDRILLLHAVTASMPSMFFIFYGDEIGEFNDYSPDNADYKCEDTRYLLRGAYDWNSSSLIQKDENSYQSKIFNGIKKIIDARLKCKSFSDNKRTVFINSYSNGINYDEVDNGILIFKRIQNDDNFIIFIFNFCQYRRHLNIQKTDINGKFVDLITGEIIENINDFVINGYGYLWLKPLNE